jgi:hypothetical protein
MILKAWLVNSITSLTILFIAGCQQEKNIDYYLLNPEKLQSAYQNCLAVNVTDLSQADNCKVVTQAMLIMKDVANESATRPNQFAMNIMQAEIKIVNLQKAYKLAQSSNNVELANQIKQAIHEQQIQIQSRFAVIRLMQ